MKIERIVLENFGIYTRKSFEFGCAPLVLIYGANESGKTTALNGLRQAIFGFRPRTPYLTGGTMSAEVIAKLASGGRLEFSRRKGRPDDLSGTLDSFKLSASDIQKQLCDLDLDSYEQLFGFSQDELRRGQDALKSARLTEALAGGSLGGMNSLERLRFELSESLSELYKSRGSTSKINVKLSDLRASHERLREKEILPNAIEELRRELSAAQQESEDCRSQYNQLYHERSARQRLLDALPKFRARAAVQFQLDAMDVPAGLDSSFVAQWGDYLDQRKALGANIESDQAALELEQAELQQIGGDHEIFRFEQEVERLGHQSGEMASLRLRREQLQQSHQEARASCTRLLENLQLEAVNEWVASFAISVPLRQELESLSIEFMSIATELIGTRARLEAATETLQTMQDIQSDLCPENLPELNGLVGRLLEAEGDAQQKARRLEQSQNNTGFRELTKRVASLLPKDIEPDTNWPTLEEPVVANALKRLQDAVGECEQHAATKTSLEQELHQARTNLDKTVAGDANQTLAKVQLFAQQRDALIDEWLGELSVPLIAASVSVEQQQERLCELKRIASASDRLQLELSEIADSIAAGNQERRNVESLAKKIEAFSKLRLVLDHEVSEATQAWRQLWSVYPIGLVDSATLLQWCGDFRTWQTQALQMMEFRRELHFSRGTIRTLRGLLLDAWPTNIREDVDGRLLQQHVQTWEANIRNRVQQQSQTLATQQLVQSLSSKLKQLEQRQQEIAVRYEEWLRGAPVTADWPIQRVTDLLDSLERVRREHQVIEQTSAQIAELDTSIATFLEDVQRLDEALAEPNSPLPSGRDVHQTISQAEVRAKRRLTWLHSLREEKTRRIRLGATIDHRKLRLKECLARRTQIDARLAALCEANQMQASGESSLASMSAMVDRIRQAEKLQAEVDQLTASLTAFCPHDELDSFLNSLQKADQSLLELEIQQSTQRLSSLDETRKVADERVGALVQNIDQLANSREAQRNLQRLHSQRGELVELTEQWVVERLAQELLTRAIERFASEHEPALLRLTRDYLSKLTGGRYSSVEHDKVDKGKFIVRNARDEAFLPERLSTGTREQLYLAIRMAFISHHCDTAEPLPVVMDDCFVNFDDTRTRYAIQAISDWQDSIQTILLSCHSRVVRILADIAPDTPVIHLEKDLTTTAGAMVDEALVAT